MKPTKKGHNLLQNLPALLPQSKASQSDSARSNVPGRRKDWVLPLPFDPPSAADIHSLHDLLRVTLPENPPSYRDGALTGMKTVTEHEFAISAEAPLKKVVNVPDLVTQLRDQAEKQLSNLKIDMDTLNPDLLSVCQMHPYLTARNLPQKIHSEKDTEDWCNAVLFRPALAALRCVIAKKIIHNFEFKYPYISSAPGRKVIPDGILVRKNTLFHQESDSDFWYIKDGKVILTIEVKTQPAWEKMRFEKLQALPVHFEKGTAMRFVWPTREDKPDEQTRLLVQLRLSFSSAVDNTLLVFLLTGVDTYSEVSARHRDPFDSTLDYIPVARAKRR
ncbi:hypothetical protein SCP_1501090 [Sparassis crispa]|uniref:Uncharacterized protein n=1 Tax=Sparassis crispa TaxID=139825 RepID=A0A401H3T5_9APHY|nr:hypothetical protein SCP_1501090 [Sparassis crispa]GBE89106.1 hypothetical protein SCP_1501090 [Sparassis crispa]